MEVAFFDTSALAKRYIDEKGSAWVADFFSDEVDSLAYIAEITIVELTSAVEGRLLIVGRSQRTFRYFR